METERFDVLSNLKAGQGGTVVALEGGQECQTRLTSMGVHIGCDLKVLHSAGGSDTPTLVAIGDTRLAVGHDLVENILIATDPA